MFAYMGPPEREPPLPPFEGLVRGDGSRKADYHPINSNYLQHLEGALDPIHSTYLHMAGWSQMKERVLAQPQVEVSLEETEWGLWRRSSRAASAASPGSPRARAGPGPTGGAGSDTSVEAWLDLTKGPAKVRADVVRQLKGEVDGPQRTGMRPFVRNGELRFHQRTALVVGRVAPAAKLTARPQIS